MLSALAAAATPLRPPATAARHALAAAVTNPAWIHEPNRSKQTEPAVDRFIIAAGSVCHAAPVLSSEPARCSVNDSFARRLAQARAAGSPLVAAHNYTDRYRRTRGYTPD